MVYVIAGIVNAICFIWIINLIRKLGWKGLIGSGHWNAKVDIGLSILAFWVSVVGGPIQGLMFIATSFAVSIWLRIETAWKSRKGATR